ncbi:hypothetical protein NUU61_002301 [Penicillium alfredii]|uniref:Beta-lactamase-related domain-containing protein n=1 Tax=Penicillium alfredii TaxID=1506179 RepID=A0A9W9KFV0_9EURO|nr:uncharacterized protein NUU61_002301 [Penicillium alfredii]KAJ5104954.1 hypothetical protein NUU61_002301 [Penicillium alfredii]
MAQVHGHCGPAFTKVQELIQQNLLSEEELGLSLCVNINGTDVIDVWGGHADQACSKPWTKDTITGVWSTTKCVTNLAALILIDRGLLDPSAKVSQYWPEFGANGKEDTRVWHVLTHSAGLPAWEQPVSIEDLYDTQKATERLAGQAPWWTPGSAPGYHAVTQGFMVGELVRRVTGKSVTDFIAEELVGPLDADFQLGAKEEDWSRVAELMPPPAFVPPPDFDPNSLPVRAGTSPLMEAEYSAMGGFRCAEIAGIGGFGNAKGIAKILSALSLGGTVDGKKLLSPGAVRLAFTEQISGTDLVLGQQTRYGLGFGLPSEGGVSWIREGCCYWGGWGGSMAIMDVKNRVTICYTPSRMQNPGANWDSRLDSYAKAIWDALGE